MIIHDVDSNNLVHLKKLTMMTLILSLILLLGACGNDSTDSNDKYNQASASKENHCGITIDDSAWQVFSELNDQNNSGTLPSRADYQVFADLPIISQWKESMEGHLPSVRIVNWLDVAFADQDDSKKEDKHNLDRRHFRASYRYSMEYAHQMDPLIQEFNSEDHCCSLKDLISFWIAPDVRPDSLVIAIFPSKPEIRILENFLFVDTGVLQAGSINQLKGQLVAMLFRSTMVLYGDPPTACEGQLAVAHSLRTMMNEGIIDYIQNQPGTIFSPDHPKLGIVNIVPERVFDHGRRAINMFNGYMPDMLASDENMQKNGRELAKTLIASSSLKQGGYSMSSTIVARLGEQRLRDTAGSPAAFLATYQEAAKMNPQPTPEAYDVPLDLYLCMLPFEDEVFEGLMKIVTEAFPESL